ncbi:MAG: membrane protein insertase YidC [Verrucomicrobia bacterium]|nr:membrane protein insertase YidC [Verrucomicrobiota bacterium]
MDRRNLLFIVALTASLFVVNLFFSNRRAPEAPLEPETAPAEMVELQASPPSSVSSNEEKFYVLENSYQQLVFSNVGGAIAEINLPFKNAQNSVSLVNEIGLDRTMEQRYPNNDRYPINSYFIPGASPTSPQLREKRAVGGYYPLLRRPIIGEKGERLSVVDPKFYALNIVSKYPEMATQVYEVVHFDKNKIIFESKQGRRTIRKTFSLASNPNEEPYMLHLTLDVDGEREWTQGLWLTSGVPDVELMSGRPMNGLKYRTLRGNKGEVESGPTPKAGKSVLSSSGHPQWIVNSNGYFGILLNPQNQIGGGYRADYVLGQELLSRLVVIDAEHQLYKADRLFGYLTALPLAPQGGHMEMRVFAGPLDKELLKKLDAVYTDPLTGQNPDFLDSRSFHGYFKFISRPFSKFLLLIMQFFYWLTHSWAFSIILLTVVLRLMLYPLASWGMRSMKRMQLIQPQIQEIQKKNKKNPRKGQIEVMNLYRKEKVNPFLGCFPLIIQMPFLIGMFDLLRSTYSLRGAGFIPGWIDNLTAPDVLFSWATPIFFIGTEFHLLPIILAGVMLLQQRFASGLPKDKTLWTDQQKQQRTMSNVMVVVFGVMFYNFPSGLCLYFMSSMLLSIGQQWLVNRQMDKQQFNRSSEKSKALKVVR